MYLGRSRVLHCFEYGFAVLLLVTGVAKLVSSTGHDRVLLQPDPVFQISNKTLFLTVGAAEVILASAMLRSLRRNKPIIYLLAAISTGILGYRLCAYEMGFPGYCKCLGTLTHQIGLDEAAASTGLLVVAALMFVYAHTRIVLEHSRIRRSAL